MMPFNRLFDYVLAGFFLLAAVSCRNGDVGSGNKALVVIGDTCLYDSEVALAYAARSRNEDSIAFVKDYAERWAMEMLFYRKALQNVPENSEIERMVANYRKSLILNEYQDGLIRQHLVPTISEEETRKFYENNSGLFISEETMMRGFYVILDSKAKKVNDVRTWCQRRKVTDLENLEKYCVANKAVCEFYLDNWVPLAALVRNIPLTERQLSERFSRTGTVEFKGDDGKIYFVCADTILNKGAKMPLEMVAQEVKELLANSRKAEFIKEKKAALYEQAINEGTMEVNF